MANEQQLYAWMRELNVLYDVAERAFDAPEVTLDAYHRLDVAYKARLEEINAQLTHFVFVPGEDSVILALKKEIKTGIEGAVNHEESKRADSRAVNAMLRRQITGQE